MAGGPKQVVSQISDNKETVCHRDFSLFFVLSCWIYRVQRLRTSFNLLEMIKYVPCVPGTNEQGIQLVEEKDSAPAEPRKTYVIRKSFKAYHKWVAHHNLIVNSSKLQLLLLHQLLLLELLLKLLLSQ